MVLNGRHSLGSSSLVPLAATVSATSATSPSTTTCGSKSLRHFWWGILEVTEYAYPFNMCLLICTCFHCTDLPPSSILAVLTVTFLQNPVRRPPAVYLSGGKKVQIESGNIASLSVPGHSATGLLGLAWQTQSSPSPSLPPNPYGELLPSSSLRLLGSAAVLVSQTAMPFSVPLTMDSLRPRRVRLGPSPVGMCFLCRPLGLRPRPRAKPSLTLDILSGSIATTTE